MTHFELFHELSREHLITIWELPSYNMKFFSRPMTVGICTWFIKCMYVNSFFFGMYEAPQNVQSQIQGRTKKNGCLLYKKKLRNEVCIFGVRYQRYLWHKETQMGHVTWNKVGSQQRFVDLKCWWLLEQGSPRYAFWVFLPPK